MASKSVTEVRFSVPNDVLGVVDAYSFAHTLDRGQMLNLIVREWATKRLHEARVLQRVARIKPDESADSANGADDSSFATDSGFGDFRDSQRGGL
jgi:hypothetical protein